MRASEERAGEVQKVRDVLGTLWVGRGMGVASC